MNICNYIYNYIYNYGYINCENVDDENELINLIHSNKLTDNVDNYNENDIIDDIIDDIDDIDDDNISITDLIKV